MANSKDTLVDVQGLGNKRQMGPFRLEGMIGSGAMGVVYAGVGPNGESAAVKVLRAHLASPELVRRFQRESQIKIDHPNVVKILDSGADTDGTPYIAFERLEGESLAELMGRGPLSPEQSLDIGIQACRGLAAAHAKGLVHRDLKPANLFRCHDGTIKLLDFGIALWTNSDTRMTTAGIVLGTPSYLSPEQARGDMDVDPRTDVWAMGAVLYEALTGKAPFDRGAVLATVVAVIMEEPTALTTFPGVPPALAAVVTRALAKNRDRRWPSIDAMEKALREVDLSSMTIPSGVHSRQTTRGVTLLENRLVAILLADGVRDSATLESAIKRHGGMFLPLMGGRAIGLFGGESWEGDEIARATAAAVEGRAAAARMSVASGRATRAGGGIAGEVLRMAEASCAEIVDGVAVDPETARNLTSRFVVRRVKDDVVEVTGDQTDDTLASPERKGPSLYGRRSELAQLGAGVDTVLEDRRGAVVLVVGPPGIGKTRLRVEVERMVEAAGIEPTFLLVGRAQPHRREAALSLLASAVQSRARSESALKSTARIDLSAPVEERQQAVLLLAREALGSGAEADECAEFLGELLGVSMQGTVSLMAARSDAQLMADRLRLALHDYFGGLASRGPVALLVDDLQWADAASLDLLDELSDRQAEAPFLLFATARPELFEARPQLFGGRNLIRVDLRGLAAPDVASMAKSIAGRPLPDKLARAIADSTAGNPLFVEQIVIELRDQKLLDGAVDQLPLPLTVEAAVQSRLDHLPPQEKELCKRAAVFGRPFSIEEAQAIGIANAGALLTSLGRREIIGTARGRVERSRELQFRSALVAEVAYGMLADEQVEELHRTAAEHLVKLPDHDAEEVAHHYERGAEYAEAARHYAAAAVLAARRRDTLTVLRCSGRALFYGAPRDQRFAMHMARQDALRFMGRRDEQAREIVSALEHAEAPSDRARALAERAFWLSRGGRTSEALVVADVAIAAGRNANDPDVLAQVLQMKAVASIYLGKLGQAQETLKELATFRHLIGIETRAVVTECRAQLATALGDIVGRRDALLDAVDLYRQAGDVRRGAGAEANLADTYNRVGAYADAEKELRTAVEGCRRVSNRLTEGYALANLGYSITMLGREEEALPEFAAAAAIAASMRDPRLALVARVYRLRAELSSGSSDEIASEADVAATEAADVGLPALRVTALTLGARAWLAARDPKRALALSQAALALRDELGSVEEDEAEVFLTHAQALAGCGHSDEAASVLERGKARIQALATMIGDPDLRQRFLSDVAANRQLVGAAT